MIAAIMTIERVPIGIRIRKLREAKGWSQNKLSKESEVDRGYISQIESGKVISITLRIAHAIADALGEPVSALVDDDRISEHGGEYNAAPKELVAQLKTLAKEIEEAYKITDTVKIPMRGCVPAGYPTFEEETTDGYVAIPKERITRPVHSLYALKVSGNSLKGDGIEDGDILIVDKNSDIVDGKIYIIRIGNEVVARHVFRQDGELKLVSSNHDYQVVKAFEMLANGASQRKIIQETGIVRNPSSLCTLFRNPTYIGERVYNVHRNVRGKIIKVPLSDPDVIRIPHAHEAIISQEIFVRCQEILNRRRPGTGQLKETRGNYLLSGVLWCEKHNCPISGNNNRENRFYMCESLRKGGRRNSDCANIDKDAIEAAILKAVKRHVFTKQMISRALEHLVESMGDKQKAARTRGQIRKLEDEIRNLHNAIAEGISAQSLAGSIAEREHQINALKQQLNVPTITTASVDEIYEMVVDIFDSDNAQAKRDIVMSCVDRVSLTGNRAKIKFSIANNRLVNVGRTALLYTSIRPLSIILPMAIFAEVRTARR